MGRAGPGQKRGWSRYACGHRSWQQTQWTVTSTAAGRRPGCYLYLLPPNDLQCLPRPLLDSLGRLELALQIDLDARSRLARVDIDAVREGLQRDGYYLQLPPPLIPAGALRGRG